MQFRELIDHLTDICTQCNESSETEIQPLNKSDVWTTILSVAQNDMRNTSLLYPMINVYSTRFPEFRNGDPVIDEFIKDYLNSSNSFEQRTTKSAAIFRWLSYFPSSIVNNVIAAAIDLTDIYINEHNDVPFDFLLPLNDGELEDMETNTLDQLYSQLHEACESDKKAAALCVYATMCNGMGDIVEDAPSFNSELMHRFLASNDEKDKLAGCLYMVFYAEALQADQCVSEPPSFEIYNLLKPILIGQVSENLRKRSLKAFNKLIQTEILLKPEVLNDFLTLFDAFAAEPSRLPSFYKVISNIIFPDDDEMDFDDKHKEEEEANLEIVEPILNFVQAKLQDKSNPMVQGLSLDSLCDLGFKDFIIIEDVVPTAIEVCKSLLDSQQVATYPFVANFLTILKEKFMETAGDQIPPFVPIIVASLNSEQLGNLKQRIYCAGAISQLLRDNIATDQIPLLVQFITTNLELKDTKTDFNLCSVILPIIKKIGEEAANKIFTAFSAQIKVTEDEEQLSAWLTVLSKIIKNYNIQEEPVNSLVASIMSGELAIFHGSLPHITMPPIVSPFYFIRAFIKKYPTKGAPLCKQLVEWLKFTPFTSMQSLLLPLTAGLQSGCFDQELSRQFADILKAFLAKLDLGDTSQIASVCTALNSLYNIDKQILTPAVDFLRPLQNFAYSCVSMDDDAEEDDAHEELFEIMPSIANFTFNVYANDEEVEILPDLIKPLLRLLPFHPEVEDVADILANVCTLLEDMDRSTNIAVEGLKMFADVLLMKKAELEEFNLPDDLPKHMKEILKSYCKGNKKLTNEITHDFQKSRAKMNRFNMLIR